MAETINLSSICRFCLCSSTSEMHLLSDDILHNLGSYFTLDILVVDYLPNQICDECNNKVALVCEFRKTVSENEKRLLDTFTKGYDELNKYFMSLQRPKVKEEKEFNDDHFHNDEENIKEDHEEIDSIDNFTNIKENLINPTDLKSTIDKIDTQSFVDSNGVAALKFKCLTCCKSFDSQNRLLAHYNKDHYKKPEEDLKLTFHTESIQGDTVYKCSACSKVYKTKKSINRHISKGHNDARPFLCKMCGRTYKTASEIVRHGRAHNGVKLFCSHQCGYGTVYHGALKEHERRHNSSEFKYKCEKCDKGFHVKTWFLQHQNIHTGLKPFVCDICSVAFHMEKYLTTHRSLKHPQSSNLKRYVCVHCSLRCGSRNALTEHLKEHGLKTERKYLCDLCGKILSNAEQLKFHKRMHLGVKPYTCSTCNKSFAKKFNLQLHERAHSGEKPHECERCGKRYGQRSTLLRHIARHHTDSIKPKSSKSKITHSGILTSQ